MAIDIECDSLKPKYLWYICTIDVDTGEERSYKYGDGFNVDRDCIYIGHNVLGFDRPSLQTFGKFIKQDRCIDTLVVSRLVNFQIKGGHSLDAWGDRLGLPKSEFKDWGFNPDPVKETQRLQDCEKYCLQDCRITVALFKKLEKYIYSEQWKESLRVEHEMAGICNDLHINGFGFDYERAVDLRQTLAASVAQLTEELQSAFPPRSKLIREVTPRGTIHGTINRSSIPRVFGNDYDLFDIGHPFSWIELVPFNPASPQQVVERLNEAGWQPFEKTEGYKDCEKELRELQRAPKKLRDNAKIQLLGERLKEYEVFGWKISEENLETVPEPAPQGISILVKWRMLSKRLQTLDEWFEAYDEKSRAIHGQFNHIGTWTHRMSHSNPNQGNVPSVDSKYHAKELRDLAATYGRSMRSLFSVSPGHKLVGVDADGIQLRILAHYMDDRQFTEALVNGNKEDNTDVHSLNAVALGFDHSYRPRAKTFIYAWLLGAGVGKVAKILGINLGEASEAVERFIRAYPGLERLKREVIPADAARGYFIGFDGRLIRCDEYHMLAGYLQTGEQAIMKHACVSWNKELRREEIPYWLRDFVHDEWQTETIDDLATYTRIGTIQAESIKQAGDHFKLRCPLAGTAKYGNNWYETH